MKKQEVTLKREIWLYLFNMPRGRELYSPCYGQLTFEEVTEDHTIVCKDVAGCSHHFFGDGSICNHGECILFPNTSIRHWEDWQRTLFKNNDIITNMYTGEVLEFWNLQEAFKPSKSLIQISYEQYRFSSKEEQHQFHLLEP